MSTVNVSSEHLGSDATEADAQRMADLLCERGYDARYGTGPFGDVSDADWSACLDIIAEEAREAVDNAVEE